MFINWSVKSETLSSQDRMSSLQIGCPDVATGNDYLEELLPTDDPYRRFHAYLLEGREPFADMVQIKDTDGYGVEWLFRCLLLQFMEDLSDRKTERYLQKNLAAK